jgi:hypothetical protein
MQPNLTFQNFFTPKNRDLAKLNDECASEVVSGFAQPCVQTDTSEGAAPFYPLQEKKTSSKVQHDIQLPKFKTIDFYRYSKDLNCLETQIFKL